MSKYRLIEYVETNQNEDGSWGVNKVNQTDFFITVDEIPDVKEICKQLKTYEILPSVDMRKISVSDVSSEIIEFKMKKDRKPICRLEKKFYL